MSSDANDPVIELRKQDLEELLRLKLGSDLKVENFSSKSLTEAGDNYGSTILDVEVSYRQGEDRSVQKISLVAKLVQKSAILRKIFNIEITFRKEVNAYVLLSPAYETLQKEKGIPENAILDVFPKCYGARINEQGNMNKRADHTAVLLLENLKVSGYETRDRRKGLNLKHLELAISELAKFHAIPIALKMLKPQVFKETILKACEKFKTGDLGESNDEQHIESNLNSMKKVPECLPYIDKVEAIFRKEMKQKREDSFPPPSEPFATLLHNDFWVNNMMFKYDTNNTDIPSKMKFVDFQVLLYESPIRDLMFFLFSSSELGLLDKHLDDLFHLYHQVFTDFLDMLGCEVGPFSWENFCEELNNNAPKEIMHLTFMLSAVLCAEKDKAQDTASFNHEKVFESGEGTLGQEKMKNFVQIFIKRGWL